MAFSETDKTCGSGEACRRRYERDGSSSSSATDLTRGWAGSVRSLSVTGSFGRATSPRRAGLSINPKGSNFLNAFKQESTLFWPFGVLQPRCSPKVRANSKRLNFENGLTVSWICRTSLGRRASTQHQRSDFRFLHREGPSAITHLIVSNSDILISSPILRQNSLITASDPPLLASPQPCVRVSFD